MSQPNFNFTEPTKKDELWRLFKRFTFEVIGSGRKNFSARAVFHRIRWEATVVQRVEGEFKINNNLSREFALRFMAENPKYADFFRTRETTNE